MVDFGEHIRKRSLGIKIVFMWVLVALSMIIGCTAQFGQSAPSKIHGDESIMKPKAYGTCPEAPMSPLRWNAKQDTANQICCKNRHYAEYSGYWESTNFIASEAGKEVTFSDSVTGKPLFIAPKGRTWDEFVAESKAHGWPSFRDEEVVTDNVRVLNNGETVSIDGTHLGHNLPDGNGNRYCIDLVCIAGYAKDSEGNSA